MRKKILSSLVACCLSAPAASYGQEDFRTLGDQECKDWLAARKKDRELSWAYQYWVVGNLTGRNEMWSLSRKDGDPSQNPLSALGPAAAEQAFIFVDQFCVRNSSKSIGEAVRELFYALAIHKAETTLKGQLK